MQVEIMEAEATLNIIFHYHYEICILAYFYAR